MNPNERQVAGSHYNGAELQHWDYVIQALRGRYLEGNITKYVCRHRKKNGVQDLNKALHYLDKLQDVFQRAVIASLSDANGLFPMDKFIEQNELNVVEAFVVKRLAYWYRVDHLEQAREAINDLLVQAERNEKLIEAKKAGVACVFESTPSGDNWIKDRFEKFDDGVSSIDDEPGDGYINQG